MNKQWGSHNRSSHSCLKSIPKMESSHKVLINFRDGNSISIYEGYDSRSRQLLKKMHKKKRRQIFKADLKCID